MAPVLRLVKLASNPFVLLVNPAIGASSAVIRLVCVRVSEPKELVTMRVALKVPGEV